MSRLVLVNAVYFKAQWLQPFNNEDTKMGKFHISRNEEVDIPMMHMKTFFSFKHAVSLGARILELPYEVFMLCTNESKTQREFIIINWYIDISSFKIILFSITCIMAIKCKPLSCIFLYYS
jgi:hypothetical protein